MNHVIVISVSLFISACTFWCRYKDDIYDRIWSPYNFINWTQLSTTSDLMSSNSYKPPVSAMSTASTSKNSSEPLIFTFLTVNPDSEFYFYLYFSEVEKLQPHELREFNIYVNGNWWYGPLSPKYLEETTVFNLTPLGSGRIQFQIIKTENSTLPPILNAVEIYVSREFEKPQVVYPDKP